MTTKTISTYIAAGYTLSSSFSELLITKTGGVGGTGVKATASALVDNYGKVNASGSNFGIDLVAGGGVFNEQGGSISGQSGVVLGGAGYVTNNGVITATNGSAIVLTKGGTVTNGGYSNLTALISGGEIFITGGVGTVRNLATIKAGGVYLQSGGSVTNGGSGDTTAVINDYGVVVTGGPGTVSNYGLITSRSRGVEVEGGGRVTNGAATDITAKIQANIGVDTFLGATVTNFGVIRGTQGAVAMNGGGVLTNGTALDQAALVEGYTGAAIFGGAGTVVNFGTIRGDGVLLNTEGLYLGGGGRVTNGSIDDTAALIVGASGVVMATVGWWPISAPSTAPPALASSSARAGF